VKTATKFCVDIFVATIFCCINGFQRKKKATQPTDFRPNSINSRLQKKAPEMKKSGMAKDTFE